MKTIKLFLVFLCVLCAIAIVCKRISTDSENIDKQSIQNDANDYEWMPCCPPVLQLQPLNDFTREEAQYVKEQMQTFLSDIGSDTKNCMDIEILTTKKIGEECLNEMRTRFRADKILNTYKDSANNHVVIMGMLHEDISIPYKGNADWGVCGLSYKGLNAGIASTFRVRNNRDFWKVVAHEFVHAYFDYGHCPQNDNNCIIKDANGHPNFSNKRTLCNYCKLQIWRNWEKKLKKEYSLNNNTNQ